MYRDFGVWIMPNIASNWTKENTGALRGYTIALTLTPATTLIWIARALAHASVVSTIATFDSVACDGTLVYARDHNAYMRVDYMWNPPTGSSKNAYTNANDATNGMMFVLPIEHADPSSGFGDSTATNGSFPPTWEADTTRGKSLVVDMLNLAIPVSTLSENGSPTLLFSHDVPSDDSVVGVSYTEDVPAGGNIDPAWASSGGGGYYVGGIFEIFGVPAGGGAKWWFSKVQDFYDDLKKGLIPKDQIERRYQQAMAYQKAVA